MQGVAEEHCLEIHLRRSCFSFLGGGSGGEGEVKGEGRNVECVTAHSSFCIEDFEQCAARRGAISQT